MCGIVGGMSSTLHNGEIDKIKGLMILSCFRGMLGSGSMVVVPQKKHLSILTHKTDLCAAELMCEEEFLNATGKSPKIIVTHARAPTKGSNDLEFVHPHRSKHITGVHNGTMFRVMDKTVGNDESDSAAIFASIAEHGVESFVKESSGAYSLVWLDAKEGTLNFLRNDQRPMVFASIGYNDNVSTMYFASEMAQLQYVLSRSGVKLADVKFESPKPFQHIKYPMDVKHNIVPLEMKQYPDPYVVPVKAANVDYSLWGEYMDEDLPPVRRPEYKPPVKRWENKNLPAIINQNHRADATPAAFLPKVEDILKRRAVHSTTFRASSEVQHKNLIRSGPCCVCDGTPSLVTENGTTIYPVVWPVNFGIGIRQYICDDCVQTGNPIALSVLDLPHDKPTIN